MDTRLHPISVTASLNRRLYLNCLDGLGDADLAFRAGERTSSTGFLACHLLDARVYAVQLIGGKVEHPVAETLRALLSPGDLPSYPSLAELRDAWSQASDVLAARFELLPAAVLDTPSGEKLPVQDGTVLGALTFLLQHESYHIGQLALLRKMRTGQPMSYR
jgi:uncharacterized damage-inducible protein DinB